MSEPVIPERWQPIQRAWLGSVRISQAEKILEELATAEAALSEARQDADAQKEIADMRRADWEIMQQHLRTANELAAKMVADKAELSDRVNRQETAAANRHGDLLALQQQVTQQANENRGLRCAIELLQHPDAPYKIHEVLRQVTQLEAALAEATPRDKAGTGNNHNEYANACVCDKCEASRLRQQMAEAKGWIAYRDQRIREYDTQLAEWVRRARDFEQQLAEVQQIYNTNLVAEKSKSDNVIRQLHQECDARQESIDELQQQLSEAQQERDSRYKLNPGDVIVSAQVLRTSRETNDKLRRQVTQQAATIAELLAQIEQMRLLLDRST